MRKMLCIILVAILVLQTAVLVSNLTMAPSAVDGGPTGLSLIALELGSRLEPY